MTTFAEIFAWILLVVVLTGGLAYVLVFRDHLRDLFARRRRERAQKFGYQHRAARLDYDPLAFRTNQERQAYRAGWDERGRDEEQLEADALGIISAPSPEEESLNRELEKISPKPAKSYPSYDVRSSRGRH